MVCMHTNFDIDVKKAAVDVKKHDDVTYVKTPFVVAPCTRLLVRHTAGCALPWRNSIFLARRTRCWQHVVQVWVLCRDALSGDSFRFANKLITQSVGRDSFSSTDSGIISESMVAIGIVLGHELSLITPEIVIIFHRNSSLHFWSSPDILAIRPFLVVRPHLAKTVRSFQGHRSFLVSTLLSGSPFLSHECHKVVHHTLITNDSFSVIVFGDPLSFEYALQLIPKI